MELYEQIELQECPICGGAGLMEEENGWCFYAACLDCGAHTAEIPCGTRAIAPFVASNLATRDYVGTFEVKGELSGIALDIASQVIEREVNEKDHEAFINEFIKNVGEAS